jgi:peptidoglycan/LPS O-acetylase OafA/YrhL
LGGYFYFVKIKMPHQLVKRIPSLDGFRAIAIILVVLTHSRLSEGFPLQFKNIALHCSVGVNIFFVISGFLITTLLLNEQKNKGQIDIKIFYIKRAFRILPVALLYLLFLLFWRTRQEIGLKNDDLYRALTFTVNFSPSRGSWFIGHYWTLSVEEQFYIFWPAILIIFRKRLKITLVLLIGYSCFIEAFVHHYPMFYDASLYSFFSSSDSIFIGALGAIFYFETPTICQHRIFKNYFIQFTAISLILFFVMLKDDGIASYVSIPFAGTVIATASLFLMLSYINPSEKTIFKLLNCSFMTHIGMLSYSIYIWQQFFTYGGSIAWYRIFRYNIFII